MPVRLCLRLLILLITRQFATFDARCAPAGGQGEATDYAFHFNHGQELFKQMRFHEATAEFREAIRLNPDYLPAQQALAVAYAITQSFALAWEQVHRLRKSMRELPRDSLRLLNQSLSEAEAAKQLEDSKKNLDTAETTAAEQSDNPTLLPALATALNKAGDYPAAQRVADQALQLDPNQTEAHRSRRHWSGCNRPITNRSLLGGQFLTLVRWQILGSRQIDSISLLAT